MQSTQNSVNYIAGIEMPRYQSHKKVWAIKIKSVVYDEDMRTQDIEQKDEREATITPEDKGYSTFKVGARYLAKHNPREGGYYVFYEDGYESFYPAEAFEDGYTRLYNDSATGPLPTN